MQVLPTPESVLDLDPVQFQMNLEAVYFDVSFDRSLSASTRLETSRPKV